VTFRSPRPGRWPRCRRVVHLLRNSLRYASKADWSKITAGLKDVYTAPTVAAAEARFTEFADVWRGKYPAMIAMCGRSRAEFVPFLDFPVEIRKLIYTRTGSRARTHGSVRRSDAASSPRATSPRVSGFPS
jgi:transposase-like protein